jgi:hypothetical protein
LGRRASCRGRRPDFVDFGEVLNVRTRHKRREAAQLFGQVSIPTI